MNKLKGSQKDKVKQFVQWTQASERTALGCLAAHNWNLEMACDSYFTNPDQFVPPDERYQRQSVDRKKIEQLFAKYAAGSPYLSILILVPCSVSDSFLTRVDLFLSFLCILKCVFRSARYLFTC